MLLLSLGAASQAEVTTITTISSGTTNIIGDAEITTISDGIVNVSGNAVITTISAGTVTIDGAAIITTLSAGTVFFGGSATITTLSNGSVSFAGNAVVSTLSDGTVTFASTATVGTLSLGTVTFEGAATVSTLSAGTITFNGSAAVSTLTTGVITFNDVATVTAIAAGTINFNGPTASVTSINGGTLNLGATVLEVSAGVIAGVITGAQGSLLKVGPGTLTINTINTFGGGIVVAEGTLSLGIPGALGTGTVVVASGATLDLNGLGVTNAINVAAGAVVIGGPVATSVDTTGDAFVHFVLTGPAGLSKLDGGTLTLTTTNFYTGPTVISGPTSRLSVAYLADGMSSLGVSALDDPANLVLSAGGALEFAGVTATNSARSFTLNGAGKIIVGAGAAPLTFNATSTIALDPNAAATSLTLSAHNLSGTNFFNARLSAPDIAAGRGISTLIKDGVGTWVLGGPANRFRGDIRVEITNGTLSLEAGVLPGGATIVLADAATLHWAAGNAGDLSACLQVVQDATPKLDVGSNTVSFSTAPTMGSGAALEKFGVGSLHIEAAVNAPALTLSVWAGNLSVNGTAGQISVYAGGTLSGHGTVGAITINGGANLSPGNSPGTLSGESLTMLPDSTFIWQVQDAQGAAGVGFDQLTLSGNLDLTQVASGQHINLKVTSLLGQGDGSLGGDPLNFGPPAGVASRRTFTFATVAGGVLLAPGMNISDVFMMDLTDFTYSDGSTSYASLWSMQWDGAHLLTLTAVPEPATYGFSVGLLALVAAYIQRRRQVTSG